MEKTEEEKKAREDEAAQLDDLCKAIKDALGDNCLEPYRGLSLCARHWAVWLVP